MRSVLVLIVVVALYSSHCAIAQNVVRDNNIERKQIDLKNKVNQNSKLLISNPEEAFFQTENLIKEAKSIGASEEELNLLKQRVAYHYNYQVDFGKTISSAKELKEKAKTYNHPYMQAEANLYLFDAYCLNKLYDIALLELEEGQNVLNEIRQESDDLYKSRSKFYIAYANYYSSIGDVQKEIESLLASVKEQNKMSDKDKRRESQIRDLSNLANAYSRIEKYDSCKLYAEASMRLIEESKNEHERVKFINYSAIGDFYFSENNYPEALKYFQDAEKISIHHYLNIARLYRKIADTYDCLGDEGLKREYEYKLKDISLKVAETQNESLHRIIEETKQNDNSKIYIFIIAGSLMMILVLLFVAIRYQRKNKTLQHQEKVSQEYLLQQSEVDEQSFKDLIEMVKSNNPAFLGEFLKVFPNFFEKLQSVNSSIVQSEVEFCALLKLNLPTKDIARFKNLEPKTVQNKKYRIRKKLNIPENTDIYYWFSQL